MSDAPEPIGEAELAALRADFAGAATLESPPREGEAVDPERIWAAVNGQLPDHECAAIVDRLHEDPALALEWRLALALREAEAPVEVDDPPADPAATASDPANDRRYWYTGALALMAAALVLLIVLPRNDDPRGSERGIEIDGETAGALREAQTEAGIQSELDGVALPTAAFELRWTAVPGALRYELQVTTVALDPVFSAADLDRNEATVPAAALESLPAGTKLIWRVTAVMPDGQRRSSAAMSVAVQ